MRVTLYTRQNCPECRRILDMLVELSAGGRFELHESPSPDGAPVPCIRFDAPGSPFYAARDLTAEQFNAYLDEAVSSLEERGQASTPGGVKGKSAPEKRAGSAPSAAYEATHPVRSALWRHRAGAVASSLSVFLGLAWVAPLTPSWGWGDGFYNTVYSAYRLVCDQIPERSAQLGGLPVCLCWRCTAIYGGSLLFGLLYTVGRDRKVQWLNWLTRPVSLVMMLVYGLPLIVDGASHALGLRPGIDQAFSPDFWVSWQTFSADWWLRMATALLAVVGAVKFICPRLDKLGFEYERLYRLRRQPSRPVSYGTPAISLNTDL